MMPSVKGCMDRARSRDWYGNQGKQKRDLGIYRGSARDQRRRGSATARRIRDRWRRWRSATVQGIYVGGGLMDRRRWRPWRLNIGDGMEIGGGVVHVREREERIGLKERGGNGQGGGGHEIRRHGEALGIDGGAGDRRRRSASAMARRIGGGEEGRRWGLASAAARRS
ncbi:hypothetical protein E2562_019190 [Oryza meyeriana var. granulata]|uniref:Uncharacterized protein n=1 Tax=Oryza meyeriana var. granulata TaxID=110450 RepID=A0A6G1F9V8_9ORYZ|nr:hypothetical protein E2562_019190 [Oryza meyeriana var. granulata]